MRDNSYGPMFLLKYQLKTLLTWNDEFSLGFDCARTTRDDQMGPDLSGKERNISFKSHQILQHET